MKSSAHKVVTAIIVLVIAIVSVVFLSNNTATGPTAESQVVRIGYLPVVHALPLYLAAEKGYFKDAGIDAQLTKFEAPNQIIDALLSGHIDMAMAAATGITAVAESKKPNSLKIFAIAGGDDTHIADGIIVDKDSHIQSIQDLRGKKVGILPGIQWHTIAQNLFDQNNLDISKDLDLVELAIPLQAQALATRQVDALLAIEPVLTIADSMGISRSIVTSPNLKYIANPFYAGVGNVSVEFVGKSPRLFKKTIDVLEKATDEVNADVGSARKYLVNYTPLSAGLSQSVHLPIYKMYADINDSDVNAVQKFIDVFIKYGVITGALDASLIIYSE